MLLLNPFASCNVGASNYHSSPFLKMMRYFVNSLRYELTSS
jgi:hypothetical protein